MMDRITAQSGFRRILIHAAVFGAATFSGPIVMAGECPVPLKADVRAPVSHAGKAVTDTVLAAIDLEKEPANIKDRQLRFRKLTIEPAALCLGTVTAIVPRSSTSPRARLWNMRATAPRRLRTKPAT